MAILSLLRLGTEVKRACGFPRPLDALIGSSIVWRPSAFDRGSRLDVSLLVLRAGVFPARAELPRPAPTAEA